MGSVGNVPVYDYVKNDIDKHNQEADINRGTETNNSEVDPGDTYGKLLGFTVLLACIFCLQFSAFNGAQNMVAQIYGDLGYSDLGNYTLGMVYFTFGIVCLFVGNVEQ